MLLSIFVPHFPHLKIGVMLVLLPRLVVKTQWHNPYKELSRVVAHCQLSRESYYFLLKNIKFLPNAFLTTHKIFFDFSDLPESGTYCYLSNLTLLPEGVYIKAISPKCALTMHTFLLLPNFCSCLFLTLECLTPFIQHSVKPQLLYSPISHSPHGSCHFLISLILSNYLYCPISTA